MQQARLDDPLSRLARSLATLPEVRLAYLFGSRARGRARAESDFDIAVWVDGVPIHEGAGRLECLRRLAGTLGREVSSVLLDLVILNDAPVLLRHRIVRDGTLLFQRDPRDRVGFVTATLREYQDGGWRRRVLLERRIRRLKETTGHVGQGDLLEKARSAARLLAKAGGLS